MLPRIIPVTWGVQARAKISVLPSRLAYRTNHCVQTVPRSCQRKRLIHEMNGNETAISKTSRVSWKCFILSSTQLTKRQLHVTSVQRTWSNIPKEIKSRTIKQDRQIYTSTNVRRQRKRNVRTIMSDEASSGRVDDVDALAGVLPAYILAHVAALLAASAAIRALEPRGQTALVAQVSPEALDHGVTVTALWTYVITATASSSSNRRPSDDARGRVGLRWIV